MNPLVELNLAMILFLPWFAILGWAYWYWPRQPRGRTRRLYDAGALALATGAGVWSTWLSLDIADTSYGKLWPQILASTLSYAAFLGVVLVAILLRRQLLRRGALAR
ncbi:hypothetical protein [Arenimonas composti]|uniref:Transmembrane protein n=1 Tax=Arenimonas composti TR7-09 = DSM 18010 TaxID=1121013 RepID=A0A091BAK6_9GAMM|nr:hypothetical protein [Arenimonas composti]KFN49708.1 hypothetical protein P873_09125 [Arenimonas composti TR7-09 = DSM 18010]